MHREGIIVGWFAIALGDDNDLFLLRAVHGNGESHHCLTQHLATR